MLPNDCMVGRDSDFGLRSGMHFLGASGIIQNTEIVKQEMCTN